MNSKGNPNSKYMESENILLFSVWYMAEEVDMLNERYVCLSVCF